MLVRQPNYSPDEAARRGELIYEQSIRSQVEAETPVSMLQ